MKVNLLRQQNAALRPLKVLKYAAFAVQTLRPCKPDFRPNKKKLNRKITIELSHFLANVLGSQYRNPTILMGTLSHGQNLGYLYIPRHYYKVIIRNILYELSLIVLYCE